MGGMMGGMKGGMGMRGMMMGGGPDLAEQVKNQKRAHWCCKLCCELPVIIVMIVLSSIIGYLNSNVKVFYMAFNLP